MAPLQNLLSPPPSLSSLLYPHPILTFSSSCPIHMLGCSFSWSSRGDGGLLSWNSQANCSWFYLKLLTTNVLCVHVVPLIKVLCYYCSFITCALVLVTLFFGSWPSCIAMFSWSSTFDLLALLPCTLPQFMPSCVVELCCSSSPDALALLH